MAGTQRYVAFLRGVSPMNCRMADLRDALERSGLSDVKTVLSSGNAVFTARPKAETALARQVQQAVERHVGKSFFTLIRSVPELQELLSSDPFAGFELPKTAKRVVTFLSQPPPRDLTLPSAVDGARILACRRSAILTAYVPSPKGPVFMTLLEKTFGKDITTRSWDTVVKCAT